MAASATLDLIVNLKGVDEADRDLGRMSGTLGTLSKAAAGLAVGALVGIGGGLGAAALAGLNMNSSMEQVTAKLNAMTKDGGKTAEILEMIRTRAAKTPFEFSAMAEAATSLLPAAKQAGLGLEGLIETAEILAASNPAEGLEGASVALREALSGDWTSLAERFNIPRSEINRLKEEGLPAIDIVRQAMMGMGLDASLVANMAQTMSGRWSTVKDVLIGLAATATQPIFDALSSAMGELGVILEANMPLLESIATAIGQTLVTGTQTLFTTMQPLIELLGPHLQPILVGLAVAITAALIPAMVSAIATLGTLIATAAVAAAPFVALGLAAGALYAAWQTNFLGIRDITATVFDWLKATVWPWFETAFNWMKDTILPAVRAAWETVWPLIRAAVSTVYDFFKGTVWPWLATAFGWLKDTILPAVQRIFETSWEGNKLAVTAAYTLFKDTIWPWLKTAFENVQTWLGNVKDTFDRYWPIIQAAVRTFYDYFSGTVMPNIQTFLANLETWITNVQTTWNTQISIIQGWLLGLYNKVLEVKNNIGTVIENLKLLFTTGWATVQSTVQSTWSTIAGYITGPLNTAESIVNGIISRIKGIIQGAIDLVNSLIGRINAIPAVPDMESGGGGGSGFGTNALTRPTTFGTLSTVPAPVAAGPTVGTLIINPSPGMDERALAELAVQAVARENRKLRHR